jgi:hypothetical protein
VTITPPALEQLTISATAATDETCPGTQGSLVFKVTTSAALTSDQINAAKAFITGPNKVKALCNGTDVTSGASTGTEFRVECTGLDAGAYTLDISVPTTQNASEWRARGPRAAGPHRVLQR